MQRLGKLGTTVYRKNNIKDRFIFGFIVCTYSCALRFIPVHTFSERNCESPDSMLDSHWVLVCS